MASGLDADGGRGSGSSRWSRRGVARATIAVLIAGLAWRALRYGLDFPVWGDEAFVAATVLERDLAGLARVPEFYQIVPPGFLFVEWLAARRLGPTELVLRLVPFLSGVASLFLFRHFCRGVATNRVALIAVAILAASFYPVRHATEAKPYATDLLISMALTSAGWAVYRRIGSTPRWLVLIALAVVAVWCSYPSVFPASAVGLVLGARVVRERTARARWFWAAYCVLLIASWTPMYWFFAEPQASAAPFLKQLVTWRDAFPPIARPWELPGWVVRTHTGLMLAYPQGGCNYGSAATTFLVVSGSIRMARRRARRPLLLLLLGPLAPALLAAAMQRYPYGTSTRVMLYMAPAFCLLAAEGLMSIFLRCRRPHRGSILTARVLILFAIAGVVHDIVWPYTSYDNVIQRRQARQVAALADPGDEFIVFNDVTPPPPIPNLMITRWIQRVAVARYYLRGLVPARVRWGPVPTTVCPGPGRRAWLIVHRHGNKKFFSEDRLAVYRAALSDRLGAPRFFRRFQLPNDETWTIWAYPRRGPQCAESPGARQGREAPRPGCTSSARKARGAGRSGRRGRVHVRRG